MLTFRKTANTWVHSRDLSKQPWVTFYLFVMVPSFIQDQPAFFKNDNLSMWSEHSCQAGSAEWNVYMTGVDIMFSVSHSHDTLHMVDVHSKAVCQWCWVFSGSVWADECCGLSQERSHWDTKYPGNSVLCYVLYFVYYNLAFAVSFLSLTTNTRGQFHARCDTSTEISSCHVYQMHLMGQ